MMAISYKCIVWIHIARDIELYWIMDPHSAHSAQCQVYMQLCIVQLYMHVCHTGAGGDSIHYIVGALSYHRLVLQSAHN